MESESILDEIGEEQGWNDKSKLALCLEYIEGQQSNDTFKDFLQDQQFIENQEEDAG